MSSERSSSARLARPPRGLDRRAWWPALALVIALAAALRLAGLDRSPPGLHYDEAAYGLQALELLAHPRLQLFFPAFTGREPLFIYLLAAGLDLLGSGVWAARAVAALVGTAAVLTTALAGRALFGPAVGLLGAALLAVSFWHVTISRMTYRAGLVAALAPLALWLLWRLWQRPGAVRALLAGGALGLLAYSYVAVRLLPLALLAFALAELAAGPLRERRRLTAATLAALVAALVAAPLGLYFLRHPEDFGVRFAQTVGLGKGDEAPASPILRGIAATLGMYGLRGDSLEKYNLPLRPALDPVLAALFALGLVALLARVRRSESRLVLTWLVGALAPGFVTADSPNFLRLIGAAPPSYLIAALGAATAARLAFCRAAPGAGWGEVAGAAGLALALVSAEGLQTARDYFGRWAPSAATYYALHGDMADLGRMAAESAPDRTTYVASEHYRHPTVAFLAGAAFERLRWFDGRDALVLPPPDRAADYLIPRSARPPDLAPLGTPTASLLDPDGQPAVERLELAARPAAATAGPAEGIVFAR
ncbi:MAG TPA: glycosyltransferase family 39 protein, partial [Chloroflexota bacterium]